MQNNYKVINASAGSGKTYALVQNLLAICLKSPTQENKIQNILALTFTNKAANEMKHRIIDWLKAFSSAQYNTNKALLDIQQKLKSQEIVVSLEELHRRSNKILDFVLHNYSTLNISTIDKFNARLVRSFSYELGLAQNFNLEINPEPFLIEAVDKMLQDIGEKNDVSDAFMDFVNYSLDNNDRVNLNKTLYDSAKEYVQDKHYFRLHDNKDFDWEVYENAKKNLRETILNLKAESLKTTQDCLNIMQEKNLEPADFAGGINGIGGFFVKFLDKKEPKLYDNLIDEEKKITAIRKGAASKSKNRQGEILEIVEHLLDCRAKIIQNYVQIQKKQKVLKALLPLKVNKDIQDQLGKIEEENDLVLLSKFNILIHENLRNEPTSFIYEKAGSQFSHYFFDEFQDTSFLQWQNMLPLKDHAIATDNMSFTLVGDLKQSIYRFRGGDSQIMLDIINKKENSLIFAESENLEHNWRSAKNIVDFNNRLYQYFSGETQEEHRDIFGSGSQQKAVSKEEGRVKINLIDNSTKYLYYDSVAEKMQIDIQNCVDHGFNLSDITILCRGNTDIFSYSKLLGSLKINYQGKEDYIKTISESGLTLDLSSTLKALTEFLRWEQNPKNFQFPVKMLYYLKVLGRITIVDFSAEIMELLKCATKAEMQELIQEKYGLKLKNTDLLQLNLYHFIEHFLQEFSVPHQETDFLFNYLEMVYAYSQNSSSTLKEFLKYWDEEAHSKTIQSSDNLDAMNLMTIHKSKGLEFPIVFFPMQNNNKDGQFSDWLVISEEKGLAAVNVNSFENSLLIYDPEMEEFNRHHTYQNKIDRFCQHYVATTRAVEQLYFYLEKPNKSKNHLEIYDFISGSIPVDEAGEPVNSFDFYPISAADLRPKKAKEKEKLITQSIVFTTEKERNPKAIKIATPSKSYQNSVEKVRIGIFTHEILAKINTEKDIEKTLETYLLAGTITNAEKTEIAARLFGIMRNPAYEKYFKEHQKVINEKDMMITENGESRLYRPDRLIETENGYIIIDFKTGEAAEKHQLQIEEYQMVLEKLGKKVVEKTLIYV
jgi:ATP-dependent exoDNAse (exonuclease V) beta subunit